MTAEAALAQTQVHVAGNPCTFAVRPGTDLIPSLTAFRIAFDLRMHHHLIAAVLSRGSEA